MTSRIRARRAQGIGTRVASFAPVAFVTRRKTANATRLFHVTAVAALYVLTSANSCGDEVATIRCNAGSETLTAQLAPGSCVELVTTDCGPAGAEAQASSLSFSRSAPQKEQTPTAWPDTVELRNHDDLAFVCASSNAEPGRWTLSFSYQPTGAAERSALRADRSTRAIEVIVSGYRSWTVELVPLFDGVNSILMDQTLQLEVLVHNALVAPDGVTFATQYVDGRGCGDPTMPSAGPGRPTVTPIDALAPTDDLTLRRGTYELAEPGALGCLRIRANAERGNTINTAEIHVAVRELSPLVAVITAEDFTTNSAPRIDGLESTSDPRASIRPDGFEWQFERSREGTLNTFVALAETEFACSDPASACQINGPLVVGEYYRISLSVTDTGGRVATGQLVRQVHR